jgi:SHS2 domain-containing protein
MPDSNGNNYSVSDYSGDVQIEGRGQDCLEALANASRALVNQIVPLDRIEEAEERHVSVSGDRQEDRFIAFLNEILYLVYTKHWLPRRVRQMTQCNRTGCRELEAVLIGEPVDSARHEFQYDIKAVTYHNFEICTEGDTTVIRFVCDL